MAHQLTAYTMNRLDILLLYRFHFDVSHIRPAHRLADRLSVIGVILITLDVGRNELWWYQLHLVAMLSKYPGPVMGSCTGLHETRTRGGCAVAGVAATPFLRFVPILWEC